MTESDFDKALGKRIQKHRKAKRFSQVELGNRLDLSRSSIANIENGFHKPSIYQLYSICLTLSLPLEELLLPLSDMKPISKSNSQYEQLKNSIAFNHGSNRL